jgi:hypothetical protein
VASHIASRRQPAVGITKTIVSSRRTWPGNPRGSLVRRRGHHARVSGTRANDATYRHSRRLAVQAAARQRVEGKSGRRDGASPGMTGTARGQAQLRRHSYSQTRTPFCNLKFWSRTRTKSSTLTAPSHTKQHATFLRSFCNTSQISSRASLRSRRRSITQRSIAFIPLAA